MLWSEYFTTINWYLKDIAETGDFGDPYSRLNETMAVRLTNQLRDELCLKNPERFCQEYAQIISTPMLSENNKVLTLPENIAVVYGYKINQDDVYVSIPTSTTSSTIRKRNDRQLYNDDGWIVDSTIWLDCAIFPTAITTITEQTEVEFPRGWELLLQLCVVQEVKNQSGEDMPASLQGRMMELMRQWLFDAGKIRETITFKNKRRGIGV